MIAGGQGAVLAFDRAKLHYDYEFNSVDFDSHGVARVNFGYTGMEQEECAFEDVRNLDRYVTGILVDREGFKRYCAFLRETISDDTEAMKVIAAGEAWVARFSG